MEFWIPPIVALLVSNSKPTNRMLSIWIQTLSGLAFIFEGNNNIFYIFISIRWHIVINILYISYNGKCSCMVGGFVNDCTIFFVNVSINNYHYFIGHYFTLQMYRWIQGQYQNGQKGWYSSEACFYFHF